MPLPQRGAMTGDHADPGQQARTPERTLQMRTTVFALTVIAGVGTSLPVAAQTQSYPVTQSLLDRIVTAGMYEACKPGSVTPAGSMILNRLASGYTAKQIDVASFEYGQALRPYIQKDNTVMDGLCRITLQSSDARKIVADFNEQGQNLAGSMASQKPWWKVW